MKLPYKNFGAINFFMNHIIPRIDSEVAHSKSQIFQLTFAKEFRILYLAGRRFFISNSDVVYRQ